MTTYQYVLPVALVIRRIMMTIGALLFVALSAHTAVSSLSPKAAHHMSDVQPEIHDNRLAFTRR